MKYIDLVSKNKKERTAYIESEANKLFFSYQKYYQNLTFKERILIYRYSYQYHEDINFVLSNEALGKDKLPYKREYRFPWYVNKVKKDADLLNSIIEKSFLPTDVVVFRGTNYDELRKNNVIKDSTIRNLIIYSTSLSPTIARSFGRREHGYGKDNDQYIILELELPTNYPALYIEPFSYMFKEEEILLKTNSTFKITDEVDYIDINGDNKIPVKIIKLKPEKGC